MNRPATAIDRELIFVLTIVTSQPTIGERKQNPSDRKLNVERGTPSAI